MNDISALEQSGVPESLSPREAKLFRRAKDLAPLIEREAAASEAGRTLSPVLVEAFRDSELFWLCVPEEFGGGGGAGLAGTVQILEEVTRADGSAGWTLMANTGAVAIAASFLGPKAFDTVFGGSERPIMAGMLGPAGKSVQVSGGYQAGGKFQFGSGAAHANWMAAGMLVMEEGKPRMLPSGLPEVRICFMPKDKVKMLDGWNVTGLVGTGSFDYEVPDQFVPDDFTMERTSTAPERGRSAGIAVYGSAGHASIALGLMKRALQEVVQIATEKKRPGYNTVLAKNDLFRNEFSVNEATYQATRDYVLHVFSDCDATLLSGSPLSPEQCARARQCNTWAHRNGADVVRFAHQWCGAQAVRTPTDMGRVSNDMAVATNHIFVDRVTLTDAAGPIIETWLRRR
ncbi:MAG TPA: acyl-CoA dehydrogenase family protein [Steroidobacteraceae bacterium]|jgi:alkylation response protein AidB-like acyl-CoA dehydrogenase